MANQTINIDVQIKSKKTLAELEESLADINEELRSVDRNSQAFEDLTKQAQALERELEDVNSQIRGFTAEDKFMAADGAIKTFAGTLQAAVGTLGAFGIESEVFGEFERKAASFIAIGIGIKDISEGYRQLSLAFKAATGAQLGFNAATLANPYVAAGAVVVTIIGSIVAKFEEFSQVLKDAGLGSIDLGAAFERMGDLFNGVTTAIAKTAGKLVAGFAALFRLDFKEAGKQFGNINVKTDFDQGVIAGIQKRLTKQGQDDATAYMEARNAKLAELQAQWAFEEELQAVQDEVQEWFAGEGEKAGMSFANAFNRTVKDEETGIDIDTLPEFVDIDELDDMEALDAMLQDYNKTKEDSLELDEMQRQSRLQLLSVIEATANQETAIGKAAFIARQALLIQEITAETTAAARRMALKMGEATVDSQAGLVKTLASVPFPFNAILGAAYLVQIGAVLSNIRNTLRSNKVNTSSAMAPPSLAVQPAPQPQVQTVQDQAAVPAFRTYVLSGDVRSEEEADAKILSRRTLN